MALTLSDTFCVDRYRDEFLGLIRDGVVDIVFANESELHALFQTADFDAALTALRQEKILAAVTRSEKGAVILRAGEIVSVPAAPIEKLVDTTGAGDLFAAGFLAGFTRGNRLTIAPGSGRWRRRKSSSILARGPKSIWPDSPRRAATCTRSDA